MGEISKIQWTDATWNVAVGCTKVNEDCKFCYMYRGSLDGKRYDPKQIRKTTLVFNLPLKLKEPSRIFTSSLTDFFHEAIDPFRNEAWDIIRRCPQHTFQILTKRPERVEVSLPMRDEYIAHIPENVWMGMSAGKQPYFDSMWPIMESLKSRYNGIFFLSIEPLTGPIDMSDWLEEIDLGDEDQKRWLQPPNWVIVGGESGNDNGKYRYRECKIEWIESIVEQCKSAGIPIFVKQLGTHLSKQMGLNDRHGGDITEWPEHIQIRQFPQP